MKGGEAESSPRGSTYGGVGSRGGAVGVRGILAGPRSEGSAFSTRRGLALATRSLAASARAHFCLALHSPRGGSRLERVAHPPQIDARRLLQDGVGGGAFDLGQQCAQAGAAVGAGQVQATQGLEQAGGGVGV